MKQNKIVETVLNQVDIVDEISKYLSLIKKGQNYFALCPFHDDTRPSLVISRSKKIFKCFVCNEAGNVISFLSKYKKISYAKALYLLAKSINLDLSSFSNLMEQEQKELVFNKFYDANSQACQIYKNFLYEEENKNALDFLYKRGLNDDLIKQFEIGYAPKDNMLFKIMTNENNFLGENRDKNLIWTPAQLLEYSLINLNEKNEYIDFFSNRIIFPIKNDNGKIIGFSGREINTNSSWKYLNSKSSNFFQKNSELYNIDNVVSQGFKKVYLTEGYMDVISCYKYGLKNIIATMGTAFNQNHIDLLLKHKIETIILAMDNDDAGKKAAEKIGLDLIKSRINVYALNNNLRKHKDLDELVNHEGQDVFIKIMDNYYTFIDAEIDFLLTKDLFIDEKLKKVNYIEDLIVHYGDKNLLSYYAKRISDLTNIDFEDVKNKIEENINFSNQIRRYQYNLPHDVVKSEKHIYNASFLKKIFNMEQKLIFCMLNSKAIIDLFIKYLNYINLQRVSSVYKDIVNTLLEQYKIKQTSNDEEYISKILEKVNKTDPNIKNFLQKYDYFKQANSINKLDSIDITNQGIKLIIELLKERISSIKRDISITRKEKIEYLELASNSIQELESIYGKYL